MINGESCMRSTLRNLCLTLAAGVFVFSTVGCESHSDERLTEEQARKIERDVNREVERAQDDIERAQERLERRLERHLTEEEIEDLKKNIEESVENGLEKVGETLERIGARLKEDSKVEVIDYRDFKELLPERVEGLRLVDVSGSNKSGLGIRFSKIEADYEDEDNGTTMELTILDLGTMQGLTAMGFDWMDDNFNTEDINGFERTRKFGGYPGFESAEYNGSNVKAQGAAVVENRFVVAININGKNLEKDVLENVFNEFSFRNLRRMAN